MHPTSSAIRAAGQRFDAGRVASLSAVCVAWGFLASVTAGDVLLVPSQHATIQAAVNAAKPGDEVVVADGVYKGPGFVNVDFGGKAITVRSQNGSGKCLIDANHAARHFIFKSGETNASIVDGFSLHNGSGTEGGAIHCSGSSPTIRNCFIQAGWSGYHGGGVGCVAKSKPRIENCVFKDCLAGVGAGIHALGSQPTIIACLFDNCRSDLFGAGAVGCDATGSLAIDRCVFKQNTAMGFAGYGGAVHVPGGTALITNSLFHDNVATDYGGAVSVSGNGKLTLINCTLSANIADAGAAVFATSAAALVRNSIAWNNFPTEIDGSGTFDVAYCDVRGGYAGAGNLDADPLFLDATSGDYRLAGGSPCLDAADNTAVPPQVLLDLSGKPRFYDDPGAPNVGVPGGAGGAAIADMGAYERQPACKGDITGDGKTDQADLGVLLQTYDLCEGQPGYNAAANLSVAPTGPQCIDQADLGVLLQDYGCGA